MEEEVHRRLKVRSETIPSTHTHTHTPNPGMFNHCWLAEKLKRYVFFLAVLESIFLSFGCLFLKPIMAFYLRFYRSAVITGHPVRSTHAKRPQVKV